ncbi:MAG: hypothetical protein HUU29_07390 [Planctomycetaceae bacterium]|nr:hypothetical protein [Planctomycetaceae bacterium]
MPPRPPLPSQLSLPDAAPEERSRIRAQTMSDFADWLDELSLDALAERAIHLRTRLKADPDAKYTAADMSVFERACLKAREMAKRAGEERDQGSGVGGQKEKRQDTPAVIPAQAGIQSATNDMLEKESQDFTDVMPATRLGEALWRSREAGIQSLSEDIGSKKSQDWIPAFAGMTHASGNAPTPSEGDLGAQCTLSNTESLKTVESSLTPDPRPLNPAPSSTPNSAPHTPYCFKHTHHGKTKKSRHKLPRHIRRALERERHARDPG